MGFYLGARSRKALVGVHPKLIAVVKTAITLTSQDFGVFEGLRSPARQRKLFADGFSMTMRSKHIKQADGYGHAVDLVPFVNGRLDWSDEALERYDPIAEAMVAAAHQHAVSLRWGGLWVWKDYAHWELL